MPGATLPMLGALEQASPDHSPTRRVLPANTASASPIAERSARKSRHLRATLTLVAMVAALAAMAAFMLIGSKPPAKPSPRAAEQPVVGTPSTGEATGSVIVNDCFEVGSDSCLTTHPKLQEALRILQSTSTGASLIENAAKEGISVRIGTTPPNALGVFRPSQRSVTLADRLAPMSPRGQAAVLAHELRHVANWSGLKRVFQGNSFSCYNDEASAFTTEVAVWKEIIGSDRPKDWLEREIDSLAHAMETRGAGFWLEMGSLYHNECGL